MTYPSVLGGYGIPGPRGPQGPAGTGVGGELTITQTPVPEPLGPLPLTGTVEDMTVTDGGVSVVLDATWNWTGLLTLTSELPDPYTLSAEVWVTWTHDGVAVSSPTVQVSGDISSTVPLLMPVFFSLLMGGEETFTLMARTFQQDPADIVRISGRLLLSQIFVRPV